MRRDAARFGRAPMGAAHPVLAAAADRAGSAACGQRRTIGLDPVALAIVVSLVIKLYFLRVEPIPSYLRDLGNLIEAVIVGAVSHMALALGLCGFVALAGRSRIAQRLLAVVLHTAILLLACLDFLMVRYQGSHVSYVQFDLAGEAVSAIGTLTSFAHLTDAWLLLDLPILAILFWARYSRARAISVPAFAPAAGIGVFLAWSAFHFTVVGLQQDRFLYWHTDKTSLPHTSHKFTYPVRWAINAIVYLNMPREAYAHVSEPPPGLPTPPSVIGTASPHVLLIQAESLSGGALEWDYAGQPVMPYLRELAAQGIYFPNALTTKMAGGSFDADVGVLTGFHPPQSSNPYAYRFGHPPYLPEIMRSRGYSSATFDAYEAAFMRSADNHAALGIGAFHSAREREWRTSLRTLGRSAQGDREFLAWVRDRLLAAGEPQLLFVRTLSGHGPYLGREREPEIMAAIGSPFAVGTEPLLRGFAATLRYTDVAFQEMLEPLAPLIRSGRLLVVLYGDHGAGIEIREPIAGFSTTETAQKNVPLLLLGTGQAPREHADLVSLQDVPATIVRMLGIPFAYGDLAGRDILGPRPLPPLVTPWAVLGDGSRREPKARELAILRYGYGRLGAPM
jgi:phosphoglycerol transferase MdoB-like AlkP superfamily enzyme